jgi:membrane protease YdiL (CAAX protease family)
VEIVVWVVGLGLASGLPAELAGLVSERLAVPVGVAASAVLLALGAVPWWRAARPVLLGWAGLSVFGWLAAVVTGWAPVAAALDGAPVPVAFLVVNSFKVVSVALVALVCWRYGLGREALRLRRGDPLAATGVPKVRWVVLGPVVMLVVAVLFATGVPAGGGDLVAPSWGGLPAWLALLPICLAGPLVNAAAEEFLYRHATLAALDRVVSVRAAVALSSVLFGLGHLTGNPGGWTGVLYTTAFGLVCAWALVRTRGFCWNLPIHVVGDLGVVTVLLATTSR